MRAFSFLKVDFIRCKAQILMVFALLSVMALVITLNSDEVLFPVLYMLFMAVMLCGAPFNLERKSEAGFIDMLPGTKRQRVIGRYLYGVFLFVLALVLAVIIMACTVLSGHTIENYVYACTMAIVGLGLIFVTVQLTILYSIGRNKSQQMLTIIQMIPGFTMFFGCGFALDYLSEHKELSLQTLVDHQYTIGLAVLLAGIAILILGIQLCTKIVENRDFA